MIHAEFIYRRADSIKHRQNKNRQMYSSISR